jgi:16S rRNA (cytosine1402-N4)-methyltransferase
MPPGRRSTPEGQHLPVLLAEVLDVLQPQPGSVLVDATVGWAGHSAALLARLGPTGRLVGTDLDPDNLPRAQERLASLGLPFSLHHGNFAGLPTVLATEGIETVDGILADLGMSSMQVDDPERGFSYVRNGPLDMRMDRTRGRTAAQLLETISHEELVSALRELGDEPDADRVTRAILSARDHGELQSTRDLSRVICAAVPSTKDKAWRLHPKPGKWQLHPAARTFQTLRILVNRELANLDRLLRVLPQLLRPGGRAAIISFHSGEDRLVKAAFREGLRSGVYRDISSEPLRASDEERQANPRSRSAKLRWAERGEAGVDV